MGLQGCGAARLQGFRALGLQGCGAAKLQFSGAEGLRSCGTVGLQGCWAFLLWLRRFLLQLRLFLVVVVGVCSMLCGPHGSVSGRGGGFLGGAQRHSKLVGLGIE